MLKPRIIPCLLVRNKGLVKTINFKDASYIGDPINACRIFNEKEADELIVLDIDASQERREPDYKMIERLARECRMPLCYGGGIKTVSQAQRILGLGVEKVGISSAVIEMPSVVADMAGCVGSQSVVVILDIKKNGATGAYELRADNGNKHTGLCPLEFAAKMEEQGAGEIVTNSIDRDGTMMGYDIELARSMRNRIGLPLTILGGAGSLADIRMLIDEVGIIGAAAGSIFVYQGRFRAVLIRYPTRAERDMLTDHIRGKGL